ncbi:nuclear GTPase SLIP-GC-like [Polypterus senegalus]|uniref:nuclear GTPase SLIP-GC-like n=1 Tax=Polypterus senegalus TaxID=55291 RepID=UPI001963AF28|nr:nuclear GTPase SLIP-GC-like [Polypterus senegalus]
MQSYYLVCLEAQDPSSIPLPMMAPQDDPEIFLKTFEEVAQHHSWPEQIWPLKLAPLLCGEAQLAYANFSDIKMLSYNKVKEAIIHRFRLTSDSYRQQFHSLKLLPGESPRIVAEKLNDLANKWLRPMETEKTKLFDKVVLGQFLSILPKNIQKRVQMQQPEDLESAIKFVEELFDILSNPEEGPSYQNVSLPNDHRNSPVFSEMPNNVSTSEKTAAYMVNISARLQEEAASLSHDDLLLQQTTKNKHEEHYSPANKRQCTCENEESLRRYFEKEEESRNVISRMYDKVKHLLCTGSEDVYFLEELKKKISKLKRKNIYEEIFIGIFGRTGTGKSSLINALLNEIDLLPTSSTSACTSCIVQVQSHQNYTKFKAQIELISKEEWEEELKVLIKHCKKDDDLDDTEDGEDTESDSANAKIRAVYGEDGLKKTFSELSKETNDIYKTYRKQISANTALELFERINPFIRSASQSFSNSLSLEQGCGIEVVLVDLPGTGDSNKQRNEMWKECISRCNSIWVVMEMNRGDSDKNALEILNTVLKDIACRGQCQNIIAICTKTDEYGIQSNHNVHGIPRQANSCNDNTFKAQIIRKRNTEVKQNVIDKWNKQVKKLHREESALESPIEVFTVSSKEYWNIKQGNVNILTFEETEIPKLKEHLKAIHVIQTKKAVKDYVSEVSGVISFLNVPKENAEQKAGENKMMYCKLSKTLKIEISILEIFFDITYRKLEAELAKGVVNAEKDCLKQLQQIIRPVGANFCGFHQTIRALCRNSGNFGIIDLNYKLASPIYEAVHNILTNIFM